MIFRLFIFLSLMALLITPTSARPAQSIKLTYKAYWGGFVISKVYSNVRLSDDAYQMDVAYDVTGLASIFSNMKSKSSVQGSILPDGSLMPLKFDNAGSWSKSHFTTKTRFDVRTGQITAHDIDFKFKKEAEYVPVAEARRKGPDMMSYYLDLMLDPDALTVSEDLTSETVFGGFFLLNMAHKCPEMKRLDSGRATYSGPVIACEFTDKVVDGDFIATEKKKKKRKKKKKDDTPEPVEIWFAEMEGLEAKIPVYAEFAIGWGKVRIFLADMDVAPLDADEDAP